MTTVPKDDVLLIEPERYEFAEGPTYRFGVARRDLFRALGAGLVILAASSGETPAAAQQESGGAGGRRGVGNAAPAEISAWLHIGADGAVTVYTGKVEVGQNARTSLTQAVAEELYISPTSIRMVMGDTDLTPYDAGTFGSRTTPSMAPQLRKVAAAARETLRDLAADQMKVARGDLVVANGQVVHSASKQSRTFGQLTEGRKLLQTVSAEASLTPPGEWEVIGKTLPKVDGRAFVTGGHRYTSDVKRPGMVYGKVLRPASFGATLATFDAKEAEKMPGITVVRDGDFAGVVAPSTDAAERALAAIRAEWKTTLQPSSAELFTLLKAGESGGSGGGRSEGPQGSVEEGLAAAKSRLEQSYTIAYIAHAPLEPRSAVAEWDSDGKLTVWTGTQRPFGVRSELMNAFSLPEERVRVIVPDTGSGYGGKHTGEAALEAARLARTAGKPVKLVWTREEEFSWAYFRPAGVIDIKSGASADGTITAWEFHNYNSGTAAIRPVYDIANQKVQFHNARSPLRQGSYRGLAATANHFARETHIDELAQSIGMDPLAFRMKNLKDERMRAVLQAVADRFGWGKGAAPTGRGFGIAGGFDKGGYIANCAEVSVDKTSGAVKIVRVVTAFECGAIVNPDHLKNQVEGAIVQAIGGALFEAIEFENGKITNPYFSSYRLPRFSDTPILETILLDRKDLPSAGAGEAPLVTLAPAVGNAIFAACGIRLRSLPMVPNGLPKSKPA